MRFYRKDLQITGINYFSLWFKLLQLTCKTTDRDLVDREAIIMKCLVSHARLFFRDFPFFFFPMSRNEKQMYFKVPMRQFFL
jgi:hypothetical protein